MLKTAVIPYRAVLLRALARVLPLAFLLAAWLPAPIAGQVRSASVDLDPPLTPVDSADLRAQARSAQARFERLRVRTLPLTNRFGSSPCDDQVGRMCWHHDTGGLWTPHPEDPEVGEARSGLLDELAAISERVPGDGWIRGQLVYYLVEAERHADAFQAARACPDATVSWCLALEGLVLHDEGRYVEAEAAFDQALAGLDEEMVERWTDLAPLVDGDAGDQLREAAERGDEQMLTRFWALADPLFLVPGNDRRSEHFMRHVVAELRDGARNAHGLSWGDDMAELLHRYGVEVGYERVMPRGGAIGATASVVGHEDPDSRSFLPPGRVLEAPEAVAPGDWVPGLDYAPSAYAPRYAPIVLPASSEVAVFTRGDRAVVAARFEMPSDTTLRERRGVREEHRPPAASGGGPVQAGLFVRTPHGERVAEQRVSGVETGVLTAEVPAGDHWTSVEVWSPEEGRAGRARQGLRVPQALPDLPSVSQLLLLDEGSEPRDLGEALAAWRPGDRVSPGEAFVVGWEVWGLGFRSESLDYRLTLVEREGFLRRTGQWLGLVGGGPSYELDWQESGPDSPGPTFRSVALELPELDEGDYRLRVELRVAGRDAVVVERDLRIEYPVRGDAR